MAPPQLESLRERLSVARESASFAWADLRPAARRAIVTGAVAVVGLAVGAVVLWRALATPPPPTTDDALGVARFVAGPEFKRLSSDLKRPYMKAARKNLAAIEAACRAGKVDKRTYRKAYLCSWMERRLDDMQDYYKQPPDRREAFLDQSLGYATPSGAKVAGAVVRPSAGVTAPAAGGDTKGGSPPAPAKGADKPAGDRSLLYADDQEREKFEAEKDEFEDDFLDAWSPEQKERYKQFRRAYTDRRKLHQQQAQSTAAGP